MGNKQQRVQTCEFDAHHDHTGYPEEEDVVPSFQQGSRVELGQVLGRVGPAHSGEGPQGAAEPGV